MHSKFDVFSEDDLFSNLPDQVGQTSVSCTAPATEEVDGILFTDICKGFFSSWLLLVTCHRNIPKHSNKLLRLLRTTNARIVSKDS